MKKKNNNNIMCSDVVVVVYYSGLIDGSGDEGKPLIYASQAIQDARPAKQEHMV